MYTQFSISTIAGDLVWNLNTNFIALGSLTTPTADSGSSLDHRLSAADAYIWMNIKAFTCPSTFAVKLQAWRESAQAVAAFQTSHLHYTKAL